MNKKEYFEKILDRSTEELVKELFPNGITTQERGCSKINFSVKIKYTKSKNGAFVWMKKTGLSFKQIYKLTKRFFKKIECKEKKIVKEVDQESTKMNL